ncbi:MAG: hypothetical protein JWR62_2058 [Modestobacter sp.]|jgi:hypothetical protein|nr:hypothetical protein [Modestobacter sp.]
MTTTEPVRARTFTWADPAITAAAARTAPGIDVLRAMAARLVDGTDRLLATAVSSILLIRPRPGAQVG